MSNPTHNFEHVQRDTYILASLGGSLKTAPVMGEPITSMAEAVTRSAALSIETGHPVMVLKVVGMMTALVKSPLSPDKKEDDWFFPN